MLKHWEKLSSTVIHKNPWWTYTKDDFQIPGGMKGEYHAVTTNGSSLIVPIRNDGNIILVKQYRYLCDKESIEFPCGGVKEGKSYEAMAHLELEEETGYKSENLTYAAEFNPFNGVTNEICKIFIARDLLRSTPKPDVTEEFEILFKSKVEIQELISANTIWDGMTIAAWGLVNHIL